MLKIIFFNIVMIQSIMQIDLMWEVVIFFVDIKLKINMSRSH